MERTERMNLIEQIENEFNSRLIIFMTGDRRGLETKISFEMFPMFNKHLSQIGHQDRIDLLIYSTGGITVAGYALVNLIREFCNKFTVIIPFKALSCATLIAMGADEIIMTPLGQLSPIDPSVTHPLSPVVQVGFSPQLAPVNVEDVNAFIDLAKKEMNLSEEDSMKKVLEILASGVHPLVLGAVQRSREQIAFLASNLMKSHCEDNERIEELVTILTRERFSHKYIIGRREAKEILKFNITEIETETEELIMNLFIGYNDIMCLDTPYNPEAVLSTSGSSTGRADFNTAIIESTNLTHVYRITKEIERVVTQQPNLPTPTIGYQERILQLSWIEDNEI